MPPAQQFYTYVTTLVTNAITAGIGGGLYGVDQPTLRQQMAVFLLKAKYGLCYVPPGCTGVFPDVPCPSTFANWIEDLAAQGITGGCGGGNYCPQNPVRRDQMAVFLLKAKYGSSYVPPECTGVFPDVPCPSQFADWIEQLAEEKITGGCGGGNYCPLNNNTRGQMAVFIVEDVFASIRSHHAGIRSTIVDAGATTALDDIIRNWYGIGALGETGQRHAGDPAARRSRRHLADDRGLEPHLQRHRRRHARAVHPRHSLSEASSARRWQTPCRTCSACSRSPSPARYRTNVGVVEGSGTGASVLMKFFNSAGTKLLELPFATRARRAAPAQRRPGQQRHHARRRPHRSASHRRRRQGHGLRLGGRQPHQRSAARSRGTQIDADRRHAVRAARRGRPQQRPCANWRTDMRVFNYGATPATATLTFFSGNGSAPLTANVHARARRGAHARQRRPLHVRSAERRRRHPRSTPATPASLIVTGRTYNETAAARSDSSSPP